MAALPFQGHANYGTWSIDFDYGREYYAMNELFAVLFHIFLRAFMHLGPRVWSQKLYKKYFFFYCKVMTTCLHYNEILSLEALLIKFFDIFNFFLF